MFKIMILLFKISTRQVSATWRRHSSSNCGNGGLQPSSIPSMFVVNYGKKDNHKDWAE